MNSKKVSNITDRDKSTLYNRLVGEIESVVGGNLSLVAKMSSAVAILHNGIEYFDWTGFYLVVDERLLEIGPYQGKLACLSIPFERGVCGKSARDQETIIVEDVSQFPGYIACDANAQSEIVVPILQDEKLIAVLDVDSDMKEAFNKVDQLHLEKVAKLITNPA